MAEIPYQLVDMVRDPDLWRNIAPIVMVMETANMQLPSECRRNTGLGIQVTSNGRAESTLYYVHGPDFTRLQRHWDFLPGVWYGVDIAAAERGGQLKTSFWVVEQCAKAATLLAARTYHPEKRTPRIEERKFIDSRITDPRIHADMGRFTDPVYWSEVCEETVTAMQDGHAHVDQCMMPGLFRSPIDLDRPRGFFHLIPAHFYPDPVILEPLPEFGQELPQSYQ